MLPNLSAAAVTNLRFVTAAEGTASLFEEKATLSTLKYDLRALSLSFAQALSPNPVRVFKESTTLDP